MYDDFISKYPGSSRNGIVSILWTGNKLFDSNGNEAIFLNQIYILRAWFLV